LRGARISNSKSLRSGKVSRNQKRIGISKAKRKIKIRRNNKKSLKIKTNHRRNLMFLHSLTH
jgi:hypothetical protein